MSEHKIGEQWVENGRMYKAVEGIHCSGCCYNEGDQGCYISGLGCPTDNGETDLVIRDLGHVNEYGLLPSSWGEYPDIIDFGDGSYVEVHCLLRKDLKILKAEYAYGDTRQEAIDNWNRRG